MLLEGSRICVSCVAWRLFLGRGGGTRPRAVFCSRVMYYVVEKPAESGCSDGVQAFSVSMDELTVAVEIVQGVEELYVKLPAKSLKNGC